MANGEYGHVVTVVITKNGLLCGVLESERTGELVAFFDQPNNLAIRQRVKYKPNDVTIGNKTVTIATDVAPAP